jgi:hypothetical protein
MADRPGTQHGDIWRVHNLVRGQWISHTRSVKVTVIVRSAEQAFLLGGGALGHPTTRRDLVGHIKDERCDLPATSAAHLD